MNAQQETAVPSRPKLALSMVLCGLIGAVCASAAGAAAAAGDVPAITVKYDSQSLVSDAGVRALYRRLVAASVEVCPDRSVGHPWVGEAAAKCRKEAVERAVLQVHDPRLAALHATNSKNG